MLGSLLNDKLGSMVALTVFAGIVALLVLNSPAKLSAGPITDEPSPTPQEQESLTPQEREEVPAGRSDYSIMAFNGASDDYRISVANLRDIIKQVRSMESLDSFSLIPNVLDSSLVRVEMPMDVLDDPEWRATFDSAEAWDNPVTIHFPDGSVTEMLPGSRLVAASGLVVPLPPGAEVQALTGQALPGPAAEITGEELDQIFGE